ncbi:LEM-3-like GIY-YIG domain-containing protein [Zhongshania aliphaticivorans]|uniref:LEM-3-like GIY-YIG domain-containing protein n=1 Tax=Zhongshania aliphaticivorans TaxID=1470434 RepID=UPI0012E40CFE|nr:hypothetical protein [Zhongshania aliphaticivorans]CAA0120412.1 Uncharacterised protein [Zhongshania aliphaticivorans]
MFDQKTIEHLKNYVYLLIDPETDKPFYVGEGAGNRVFEHAKAAVVDNDESLKLDKIREIINSGAEVKHLLLKHGLSKNVALKIEASIIDFSRHFSLQMTNIAGGHDSIENGLMTTEEAIRKYNAMPLTKMDSGFAIININKTYKRGSGFEGIYQATKEAWPIDRSRIPSLRYVLSEYRGLIVEAFSVQSWYEVPAVDRSGKLRVRWGFEGVVAEEAIRNSYINTSVAHLKKPGASFPIRYEVKAV